MEWGVVVRDFQKEKDEKGVVVRGQWVLTKAAGPGGRAESAGGGRSNGTLDGVGSSRGSSTGKRRRRPSK